MQRIEDQPEAGVQEGVKEKKETKRGCGTKRGQSLSGNGTYLLCSVGRLCGIAWIVSIRKCRRQSFPMHTG